MGTYDREHGVITWGGDLPGGEAWSNSLRVAETEETAPFTNDTAGWDMQGFLDFYTGILQAHHNNGGAMISNRCKLKWVKFNRVDINGRYVDQVTFRNDFAAVDGGTSGNVHPNQIACAITFTTDVTRGPANKGRLYAPMPAVAIGTDGMMSAGDADNLKDRYRSLVEDLSDIPGLDTAAGPNVVVMSRKGSGLRTRRVSGLRIGRVLDTQQRRRRSLPENYVLNDVDEGTF